MEGPGSEAWEKIIVIQAYLWAKAMYQLVVAKDKKEDKRGGREWRDF